MTVEPTTSHRHQTLSIGGATYDLFVRTAEQLHGDGTQQSIRLPVGAKIRVQEVIEACGGGAANTSVGLRRLGCDAGFCGIIGSDQWGQRILQNFERERVNTAAATIVDSETSSFSLILSVPSGERTILYNPGVNEHMHDALFDRERAAEAGWIYFNRIPEQGCMIEDDLLAILDTGAVGLTWNPGGYHLESGLREESNRLLLAHTSLLLLNKEEALQFSGASTVADALAVLHQGGATMICVTDAAGGTVATDGNQTFFCPALDTAVVDTTGAGDAFGTGATWALLEGCDLPDILRAGTINATSVIGAIGAQPGLLTDIEMRHRLQSNTLDVDER
ncbi:MAG: Sugar kinase, ribokinase family [Candidatus Peregrinibacteria bacterium Greene0416_19]|nr:MAG: Sugar kinase, ribokinase family [Candidatus Peregrinibacteria bacterium Greene0416_19]